MASNEDGGSLHSYTPIILTRRGERTALADTPGPLKADMRPVFAVEPIDWDYDLDCPSKSVDQHLANKAQDLADCWGTQPAAVDLLFLDDQPMANGDHPLVWLTAQARTLGLPLLPAVGLARTADYIAAAAAVAARDGDGLCIRLALDEWPMTVGAPALDHLMTQLGVTPAEVDLVLDLGAEIVTAPALSLTVTRAQLASLPHLMDWRSITLAGAGFPKGVADLAKTVNVIERVEWTLYLAIHASTPTRMPLYGDYVVAHPDPSVDVNPAYLQISANLRYTIEAQWLVPKGELFKGAGGRGQGGAAAVPLAHALAARPEFLGGGHCSMEDWVLEVVAGTANGGRPEAWRRHGTRHHLQVVTDQLAILGVP